MAAEAEKAAPQQAFDFERYTYVADKGPITSVSQGLHGFEYETLRLFGLAKGFSSVVGLPGFYVVNNIKFLTVDAIVTSTLPALLHPLDAAQPPVLGLRWKVAPNGNVYAMCIPTDLKLSSDADINDKWLTDADVVPKRLELFAAAEPIENKDGHALAKKVDEWISKHSNYFRSIKVKSLAAARAWLSYNKFVAQFKEVVANAEAAIKSETRIACGADDDAKKKGAKKAKGSKENVAAADAESEKRVSELNLVVTPLKLHMRHIAVPIGCRLIEVDLGDGEVSLDEADLLKLIQEATVTPHGPEQLELHEKLVELLQTADKVKLLQTGKSDIPFQSSPLPSPERPAARPATEDSEITGDAMPDVEAPIEDTGDTGMGKRHRAPVNRFESASLTAKKLKPNRSGGTDNEKPKRKYQKTGKFSKDALKRAAAAAGLLTSPDPKGGGY